MACGRVKRDGAETSPANELARPPRRPAPGGRRQPTESLGAQRHPRPYRPRWLGLAPREVELRLERPRRATSRAACGKPRTAVVAIVAGAASAIAALDAGAEPSFVRRTRTELGARLGASPPFATPYAPLIAAGLPGALVCARALAVVAGCVHAARTRDAVRAGPGLDVPPETPRL